MTRLLTGLAALALSAGIALAEGKTHHVVFQVDQNDAEVMNLTLNNVQNVEAYYKAQGDTVVLEIVAYGPGLAIYMKDQSPVADRLAALAQAEPGIAFSACGNTLAGMEKRVGHPIPLLDLARVVPSGAVRLVELQEQGYAYIRP